MSQQVEWGKIRELALLCLETRVLHDKEVDKIIAEGANISEYLRGRERFAMFGARQLKRHRERRRELEKLPTIELERMLVGMNTRTSIRRADEHNKLEDLFVPPIDSDEHIIPLILKEREVPGASDN